MIGLYPKFAAEVGWIMFKLHFYSIHKFVFLGYTFVICWLEFVIIMLTTSYDKQKEKEDQYLPGQYFTPSMSTRVLILLFITVEVNPKRRQSFGATRDSNRRFSIAAIHV